MRIGIVGYGKMGRIIADVARSRGIEVAAIIDPDAKEATARDITPDSVKDADVLIDFTAPEVALENLGKAAAAKKSVVMGTTGWYGQQDAFKKVVKESGIGFLYSSNFSVGVNVFFKIVERASQLINNVDVYDVFGYELHHNQKADSPSGTAKTIEKILLGNIARKTKIAEEKLDRKINPEEIHFASVRAGAIPGTHVVGFDSEADTIELKHTARSRQGFAQGAVLAATWLEGKSGFFEMNDFVEDLLG